MKKIILILSVIVLIGCKSEKKTESVDVESNSEEIINIPVFNYSQLEPLLSKKNDTIYVINFWATWCKPCVDELPVFERIKKNYANKKVEVLLVSLDFPDNLESRLIPFMKEHKLKSKVVLLADTDQNTWIPLINEKWSGAIPATLIYNNNKREFYEQSFTYKSLEETLSNFLN